MKYSSYQKFEWRSTIIALFFICALQIMVFGFFQMSDELLAQSRIFSLNVIFYSVMMITAVLHPTIMRRFTLKNALLLGLGCDVMGLAILLLNDTHSFPLTILSFIFVAIAIVSVINCMVTYLVIEFPKSVGLAMIALFLFANIGMTLENGLYDFLHERSYYTRFCYLAIALLLLSMTFVYAKFFNPVVPKHLAHLRRGSLVWKEFHYRMALFIFLMLLYGIVETVFSGWSSGYLQKFMSEAESNFVMTLFWASMVFGQMALFAPIYFYPARKVFSLLLLFGIGVTFYLERQTNANYLIGGYVAAGFACSIIFPILLAFFEKEAMQVCSNMPSPIPFIETGISLMVGGYLAGVGIVSLCLLKFAGEPILLTQGAFHWVIFCLGGIGLGSTYLNWSSEK